MDRELFQAIIVLEAFVEAAFGDSVSPNEVGCVSFKWPYARIFSLLTIPAPLNGNFKLLLLKCPRLQVPVQPWLFPASLRLQGNA